MAILVISMFQECKTIINAKINPLRLQKCSLSGKHSLKIVELGLPTLNSS